MISFLDFLRAIYLKEKIDSEVDNGLCIALTTALSKQEDNLPALKSISQYLLVVEPKTYFYLLFFTIPQKNFIPKNMKYEKPEKEEALSEEEKEIKDFLNWTDREFSYNREAIKEFLSLP